MSVTINEYSAKLINKILPAASQEEVKKMIDEAVNGLEQKKMIGEMAINFADHMVTELKLFSPMNKNAQQWSNIKLSKIIFHRIRHRFKITVHCNNEPVF